MNELNVNYSRAVELNQKIIMSAQLAQQNLYDMCMGFKQMRDDKLYKELGYGSFEDYCEKETGFKRRQVYSYISVVENLPVDFVQSTAQIGIQKMYLLSTLSEKEREEIAEKTDIESTTVRELEAEIKQLKQDKAKLNSDLTDAEISAATAENNRKKLEQKISELESEIKELESRPIEVAVAEPTADEKLLRETIKSLERENILQNERLEEEYRKQNQEAIQMYEKEKQEAIAEKEKELAELRSQLEQLKSKSTASTEPDENTVKFKILLTAAFDGLSRVKDFLKANPNPAFLNKAKQLAQSFLKETEG